MSTTHRTFRKARSAQRRADRAKLDEGWSYVTQAALPDGRTLTQDDEFQVSETISGIRRRGRYRFLHQTTNPRGVTWLEAFGGTGRTGNPGARREFRSFRLDQVETIHRTRKLATGRQEWI